MDEREWPEIDDDEEHKLFEQAADAIAFSIAFADGNNATNGNASLSGNVPKRQRLGPVHNDHVNLTNASGQFGVTSMSNVSGVSSNSFNSLGAVVQQSSLAPIPGHATGVLVQQLPTAAPVYHPSAPQDYVNQGVPAASGSFAQSAGGGFQPEPCKVSTAVTAVAAALLQGVASPCHQSGSNNIQHASGSAAFKVMGTATEPMPREPRLSVPSQPVAKGIAESQTAGLSGGRQPVPCGPALVLSTNFGGASHRSGTTELETQLASGKANCHTAGVSAQGQSKRQQIGGPTYRHISQHSSVMTDVMPAHVFDIASNGFHKAPLHMLEKVLGPLVHVFQAMSQKTLCFVLEAIVWCPPAWKDTVGFARGILRTKQQAGALFCGFGNMHVFCIVLVCGCTGSGIPVKAAMNVLETVKKANPGYSFRIVHAISYEISPLCINFAMPCWDQLVKAFGCKVDHLEDIVQYEETVSSLLYMFEGCKFLCIAGTECSDTSFANTAAVVPGTSPLHGPRSRTAFHWHRGMTKLASIVGNNNVVHVHEYPRCKVSADELHVNNMFGHPRSTRASEYGCAERNRYWRTSPILTGITHCKPPAVSDAEKKNWPMSCEDSAGFVWAPQSFQQRGRHQPPVVLRRYWPKLVDRAAKNNDMSQFEKATLESLRILKPNQPNSAQYAGAKFFVHHLCRPSCEFFDKIVDDQMHCLGKIDVNGMMAGSNDSSGNMCGKRNFCVNCTDAMTVLGGAWHLESAMSVMSEALKLALLDWTGRSAAQWFNWGNEAPHFCDDFCPMNSASHNTDETAEY